MVSEPITSPTNARIKAVVKLRKRRQRDATGTFIVEGYRELLRAADAGLSLRTLLFCSDLFVGTNERDLVQRCSAAGAEIIEVSPEPFAKASYRDRPEGLLAVADQFETGLDRIELTDNPLVLVAESIEKPGNLGTMLRTAEAAGISGVIVADPTTDPFNPNVVRASLGTLFTVPVAITDTAAAIDHLRVREVNIVATTPDATLSHYEADLAAPSALVVGSEQYGLSRQWLDGADTKVVIPMPGSMDSLNTATAAGIVVFEALRQRSRPSDPTSIHLA